MGSQERGGETVDAASSGGQFEELVDELNLTPNISSAHPLNLPLPQHVHRLITLNGSLRRLEFSEPLLGVHPAFDRSVVLLQNVVQVLDGSVPATAAKCPFLLYVGDGPAPSEIGVWQHRHRETLTAESQSCPRRNQWPDTGSTNGPLLEVGSEEARNRYDHAGLRPPLKLHVRFSRMQLSRRAPSGRARSKVKSE